LHIWRRATGFGLGALKDADPLKKTEAEREAIEAGRYPRYCSDRGYVDLML
jgi:hypothetical protein